MNLSHKKIIITGASGGIGGRVAELCLSEGADVTGIDRIDSPAGLPTILADLGSPEGLSAIAERLENEDVDILVNLAGLQHFGPIEDQSLDHMILSYMVNLVAPVALTKALLPKMKNRGQGHIVNIGSVFGSINFAHFATYSSAKAGLRGFSESLRREVSDIGIDVTYIAPRAVKTPFNAGKVMDFAKITSMKMDDPDMVALRIVKAMQDREKNVFIGFPESLFVRINALMPGVVDAALAGNDRKVRALFND